MNAPASAAAIDKPAANRPSPEGETSNSIEQERLTPASKLERDAERIKSSVLRLTSNSITELEGLTSELQELKEFLKSEIERVQFEIDSALAGIKIIIDAISPWRSNQVAAPRKEPLSMARGPVATSPSRGFQPLG
jgi:hypothetical protein